jgi:plasmid stabilization system protein ParE
MLVSIVVRRSIMPQGDKSKYTDKQKRKAEHIAEGYEKRGTSKPEAKSRAWATVNKDSGGGNKRGGSGHGQADTAASARSGARKQSSSKRSAAAKKGWATRKRTSTKRAQAAKSATSKRGGATKKSAASKKSGRAKKS